MLKKGQHIDHARAKTLAHRVAGETAPAGEGASALASAYLAYHLGAVGVPLR